MREGRRRKKGQRAHIARQVSPRGNFFFFQDHEGLDGGMEVEGR